MLDQGPIYGGVLRTVEGVGVSLVVSPALCACYITVINDFFRVSMDQNYDRLAVYGKAFVGVSYTGMYMLAIGL